MKKLYWKIIIVSLLAIVMVGFMLRHMGYSELKEKEKIEEEDRTQTDSPKEKILESTDFVRYRECLDACTNVYSEGVEMTMACESIRDLEKETGMILTTCLYKAATNICSCINNGNDELLCSEQLMEYLNNIGCSK